MLQQNVHVADGARPRDVGECETEFGRHGLFRPDRVSEDVAVHFRGDVQFALRHPVRAAQYDVVGDHNVRFVAGAATQDRAVERVGH